MSFQARNCSGADKIFHQYNHFQSGDSASRRTELVICKVVFLDLGTCKYDFTDCSSLLELYQRGALDQIKAHNPHFPSELPGGNRGLCLHKGVDVIWLNEKQCSERTYMVIRTVRCK